MYDHSLCLLTLFSLFCLCWYYFHIIVFMKWSDSLCYITKWILKVLTNYILQFAIMVRIFYYLRSDQVTQELFHQANFLIKDNIGWYMETCYKEKLWKWFLENVENIHFHSSLSVNPPGISHLCNYCFPFIYYLYYIIKYFRMIVRALPLFPINYNFSHFWS